MKNKILIVLILTIIMSALNVPFAMGETSFTNNGDVKIIESSLELEEYSEKLSEFMKNRKPIDEDKIYGNVKESSMNTTKAAIMSESASKAISISAGMLDFHYLMNDGTVWYYSYENYEGQIYGLNNIVSIDCGWDYHIALDDRGKVWEWTTDNHGNYTEPTEVSGLYNIKQISNCASLCMALTEDGEVWQWDRSWLNNNAHNNYNNLENINFNGYSCEYISAGSINFAIINDLDRGRTVVGWPSHPLFNNQFPISDLEEYPMLGYIFATEEDCHIKEIYNGLINYWASDSDGQNYIGGLHYGYGFRPYIYDNIIDVGTLDSDIYGSMFEVFLMKDGTVYQPKQENYAYHNILIQMEGFENIVDVEVTIGLSENDIITLDKDGNIYRGLFNGGGDNFTPFTVPGVVYDNSKLTAVVNNSDLNTGIKIKQLECIGDKLYLNADLSVNGTDVNLSGKGNVYKNISRIGRYDNLLGLDLLNHNNTSDWEIISAALESPALDQLLLPVNRGKLEGKTIIKLAFKYKPDNAIYYYEGEISDASLFDRAKAIAHNAESSEELLSEMFSKYTWFFKYMSGEGEAQEISEQDSGLLLYGTVEYTDWRKIIPKNA